MGFVELNVCLLSRLSWHSQLCDLWCWQALLFLLLQMSSLVALSCLQHGASRTVSMLLLTRTWLACSNPMAGTDTTLLGLAGAGYADGRSFGFAACERAVGASEGINLVMERRSQRPDGQVRSCTPIPLRSCCLFELVCTTCCAALVDVQSQC